MLAVKENESSVVDFLLMSDGLDLTLKNEVRHNYIKKHYLVAYVLLFNLFFIQHYLFIIF